jgi:hypothetical protein
LRGENQTISEMKKARANLQSVQCEKGFENKKMMIE